MCTSCWFWTKWNWIKQFANCGDAVLYLTITQAICAEIFFPLSLCFQFHVWMCPHHAENLFFSFLLLCAVHFTLLFGRFVVVAVVVAVCFCSFFSVLLLNCAVFIIYFFPFFIWFPNIIHLNIYTFFFFFTRVHDVGTIRHTSFRLVVSLSLSLALSLYTIQNERINLCFFLLLLQLKTLCKVTSFFNQQNRISLSIDREKTKRMILEMGFFFFFLSRIDM